MTGRLIVPLSPAERDAFVGAARARVGAPFRHRGRGPALDCIGLLVAALRAVGRDPEDRRSYGRAPDRDRLQEAVRAHFGPPVAVGRDAAAAAEPGDVVLMRWSDRPQHVAIIAAHTSGGLSAIHADSGFGAVVEHGLVAPWPARILEVYRP